MSGFSRWICSMIEPRGSSTSGIQRSSRSAMPGLWLLAPRSPGDLGGRDDHQSGEQLAEGRFGQRDGHLGAPDGSRDRGDAEDRSGAPADVSIALLAPDPDGDRRNDREQGRGLGVELREAEPGQDGDEEDAAADPEETRQDPRDDAERDGEQIVAHCSSIRIAIATRSAAKRNESVRTGSRCWSVVPPSAPNAAGIPTSAAYAGLTWPCATYVTTPAVAVIPIAASEVAVAERSSQPPTRRSSGTITIPPPTPNSALKKPAVSPMRISRTGTGLC